MCRKVELICITSFLVKRKAENSLPTYLQLLNFLGVVRKCFQTRANSVARDCWRKLFILVIIFWFPYLFVVILIRTGIVLIGNIDNCCFGKEIRGWNNSCRYSERFHLSHILITAKLTCGNGVGGEHRHCRTFRCRIQEIKNLMFFAVIDEKEKETLSEHETQLASIRWHLSEGKPSPP